MNKKNAFVRILIPIGILSMFFGMMIVLVDCSKDDDGPNGNSLPNIVRGTDTINCPECTLQDYLVGLIEASDVPGIFAAYALNPAQKWFLDVPHSAVGWSTAFNGFGADLTGKFSWFSLEEFTFDETTPSNISFEAYVLLNSVVTGHPLRDDDCLLTTYETDNNKTFEAENLASIKTIPNSGKYHSVDEGYSIDANLTFLGTEHLVTIDLYYLGQEAFTGYKVASFIAGFTFNALSDFGLSSTSIADEVTVKMDVNLRMTI